VYTAADQAEARVTLPLGTTVPAKLAELLFNAFGSICFRHQRYVSIRIYLFYGARTNGPTTYRYKIRLMH
jgi:hypothetical protein